MAPDQVDITDELSREELVARLHKLEDAYGRCQRLSLANDFAAAIMHEVNNPLEAITNLVYLARTSKKQDEVYNYLDLVQEQLPVLASIARSSLAFYKGQDEARDINLVDIAESALKLHFARLHKGNVSVKTAYCADASLRGISSELLQVIANLILNAADALTEVEQPAISIRVRRTGKTLRLMIQDNGPGIPEEMEGRLFQAHATGKKTGTGLGLWLSRRIAEKHGGSMRCRTSRKKGRSGTLFSLSLPA